MAAGWRVDVVFDFECGWDSHKSYLPILKQRIQTSLKNANSNYYVGKITAVGPPFGVKREAFRDISDFDYLSTSPQNIKCAIQGCPNFIADCRSHGVQNELIKRTTDRADVLALIQMFTNVICDGSKNILVITGDKDFLRPIQALSGYPTMTNVMVARSGDTWSEELRGKKTWNFNEMISEYGSHPIPRV